MTGRLRPDLGRLSCDRGALSDAKKHVWYFAHLRVKLSQIGASVLCCCGALVGLSITAGVSFDVQGFKVMLVSRRSLGCGRELPQPPRAGAHAGLRSGGRASRWENASGPIGNNRGLFEHTLWQSSGFVSKSSFRLVALCLLLTRRAQWGLIVGFACSRTRR